MLPLTDELLAQLAHVEVPTLGHTLDEGFLDHSICALQRGQKLVGRARTLELIEPDAYAVNEAILALHPGEVLCIRVVSGCHAPIGAVTATALRAQRAAGVIVDGPVTDRAWLEQLTDLPVYSRGVTARTTKRLPRALSRADGCVDVGGVEVSPGDILVGDENGVVRIRTRLYGGEPYLELDPQTLKHALESDAAEPALLQHMMQGDPLHRILARRPEKGPQQ